MGRERVPERERERVPEMKRRLVGSGQHESGSTPLPELGDKRSQGGKAQSDEEH